jgi:hypothetical protein
MCPWFKSWLYTVCAADASANSVAPADDSLFVPNKAIPPAGSPIDLTTEICASILQLLVNCGGAAESLHGLQDVGIELGGVPAVGRANLRGGQAESAAEIRAVQLRAVDWRIAQDCAGEGRATQVCVA